MERRRGGGQRQLRCARGVVGLLQAHPWRNFAEAPPSAEQAAEEGLSRMGARTNNEVQYRKCNNANTACNNTMYHCLTGSKANFSMNIADTGCGVAFRLSETFGHFWSFRKLETTQSESYLQQTVCVVYRMLK